MSGNVYSSSGCLHWGTKRSYPRLKYAHITVEMINLSKYENKTIIHNTNMVDKACCYCFLHVLILPFYSHMQAY